MVVTFILLLMRTVCEYEQGFAIGNGLTQPDLQYEAYADYALDNGLISNEDYKRLNKIYPACATSIKMCGKLIICQRLPRSYCHSRGGNNFVLGT